MSGFEVAGVVLGAVPIIVEGLKAYIELKRFIDVYRNKTELIAGLIQDLMYYQFSINEQVGKVLHGAGISITETQLRSGEAAEKFESALKSDAISRYLGMERFGLFLHQLRVCQAELADIVLLFSGLIAKPKKDQSGEDGYDILKRLVIMNRLSEEPLWQGAGRKLKFTYKKDDIKAKIKKLGCAAERLKDPDLQAPTQFIFADADPGDISSQALKSLVKSFELVQAQAGRLYRALVSALPRSCHDSHVIRLFLDGRTGPLQRRRHQRSRHYFKVELLGLSECGIVETWHKCDIPAGWEDDEHVPRSDPTGKQAVTLAISTTRPALARVTAICSCLRTVTAKQQALNLHLTSHGTLYYSECRETFLLQQRSRPTGGRSCITLDEVIRRTTEPGRPERNWTLRHRMTLALRLASTVMQLNRTQWLGRRCSSSSIYFERTGPTDMQVLAGAAPPFEADQPFISKSDPLPGFDVDEPELLAHVLVLDLAIVLMELWTLTTFQQKCHLQDYGGAQVYDERRCRADEWLTELENDPRQNMMPDYRYALQRCIEMTSRKYSFESEEFRLRFCEGVVKPLFAHCKDWLQ